MASSPLHIPTAALASAPGAQQQQFNHLSAAIAAQRSRLAEWQQAMAGARQRHARDIVPLQGAHRAALSALAQHLDERSDDARLSRAERSQLSALIALLCADADDAVLRELHQRHGAPSPDTAPAQTAPDNGDGDWQAQQAHAERLRQAQRQAHHSARQAAAQARQTRQAPATQSLRQVYRQLASALHPDRESDPAERARKTALMQRANQAYAAEQLLELLQLQLEAEQIDAAHLANLSEARLAHYNQVLAGQLQTLRQQVQAAEQEARQAFGIAPDQPCKPARLAALLRASAQALQQHSLWLGQQLRALRADPALLPDWLKAQQRAQQD